MVTRNHYAQSEMITVKKLFFGENFANEAFVLWIDFIEMLHPKEPASVVFLRNTFVDEIEWLHVIITFQMVTRNHYGLNGYA